MGGLLPGDEFRTALFPNLQNLIHTGHKTIRGTTKFKESMLYAKQENTTLRVPGTDASTVAFECFKGGEQIKSYTNKDLVDHATKIASSHYKLDPLSPIYMSLSMSYPLGFAAFLAAASSGRKIFHPSSFALNEVVKGFESQKAKTLICDKDLIDAEIPEGEKERVKESL